MSGRRTTTHPASAVRIAVGSVVLVLAVHVCTTVASRRPASTAGCHVDGALVRLADLPEASGIAASRSVPNRLWALNDSGDALLFALDPHGSVTARVQLTGARVDDWEAIAVGACAGGSCLYVGDIGDNNARRKQITIYSVLEPTAAKRSAQVRGAIHAVFPDGPQDAESLLVAPDGRLYVVTKGSTGPIAIYRVPQQQQQQAQSPVRLERIGKPREGGKVRNDDRITDGAMSADGEWVVLRTHRALLFYRTARLMAGDWREARVVDLEPFGEVQGEGVAMAADGSLFITGEGGGRSRPGTFAHLVCAPFRQDAR
jgi:hypothetical protein